MYLRDNIPNHLCQGDIFIRFPNKKLPNIEPKEVGFMVLNYTCDLKNYKDLNYISFCPIFKLNIHCNMT